MGRKSIIGLVILLLVIGLGFIIWQKSQVKVTPAVAPVESAIKKVDLTTQPEWVQKLEVSAISGRNPQNGLKTYTITVKGLPKDSISTLSYVIQFITTNRGSQGDFSSKPIELNGDTEYKHTGDFGTCSTKSCVVWDGVKQIDVELDFSDSSLWTGTLDLK